MSYQLIHGDCLDVLPTLEAGGVDAVITDPPYGTTACKWDAVIPFEPMWAGIKHVIKRNAAVVLFGSQPFTSALVMSNPKWFRYEWVWDKKRGNGPGIVKYRPLPSHENVLLFAQCPVTYNPQMRDGVSYGRVSGKAKRGEDNHGFGYHARVITTSEGARYPLTVMSFSHSPPKTLHPTEKPVPLLEYLIRTYTNEGDTVLDFTMGSGSTGEACLRTGRRFIGVEKDLTYFNVAQARLDRASQQLRMAV